MGRTCAVGIGAVDRMDGRNFTENWCFSMETPFSLRVGGVLRSGFHSCFVAWEITQWSSGLDAFGRQPPGTDPSKTLQVALLRVKLQPWMNVTLPVRIMLDLNHGFFYILSVGCIRDCAWTSCPTNCMLWWLGASIRGTEFWPGNITSVRAPKARGFPTTMRSRNVEHNQTMIPCIIQPSKRNQYHDHIHNNTYYTVCSHVCTYGCG